MADSAVYTGVNGNTYYFEALARDSAGNVEVFTGTAECSTYVKAPVSGYTMSGIVYLSDSPPYPDGSIVTINGKADTTDSAGHYNIPGLIADTYDIYVTHDGYYVAESSGVIVSQDTMIHFTLTKIPTYTVDGIIKLYGEDIDLSGTAVTMNGYLDSTNTFGWYEIEVEAGTYDIYITHNGYASDSFMSVVVDTDTTMPTDTLYPITYTVDGMVSGPLDSDGSIVTIDGKADTTNTFGYYEFSDIPGSTYTMTASHEGYIDAETTVVISSDTTIGFFLEYEETDTIPPTSSTASSPIKSTRLTFPVSWTIGSDEGGSGLSGKYKINIKDGASGWVTWLDSVEATSANYLGEQGHTYYFEAGAIDNAGNIEQFIEIPECSTFVDTTIPDTAAPSPPAGVLASGGDREITILWDPNTETDLAGYNVYRTDSAGGPYERINPYLITGNWYKDANLAEDVTSWYVVTAIDTSNNEGKYSNEASATTSNLAPEPVSEFTGIPLNGAKIELSWVISPSYDAYKYNLYWDEGSGNIDYVTPMAVVLHPETTWISASLTPGTQYKFGIRAEDGTGNEEQNTRMVVSVMAEGSTAGLVKAQILTPHAGKRIWGNRTTVLAKLVYGTREEVKCVKF
ncbi:MAG: hypothetical protein NWE89_07480, partial [Candidatus Bathyarchaeota archaeon]|nr:hypothetical protein [Candidatus Bathyarchaeota archaeon]